MIRGNILKINFTTVCLQSIAAEFLVVQNPQAGPYDIFDYIEDIFTPGGGATVASSASTRSPSNRSRPEGRNCLLS